VPEELPNVKALYEAMNKRADFVLIGVSLDTEKKDFEDAVSKKQITWPQVWGPESGGEETFEMLDGLGIPTRVSSVRTAGCSRNTSSVPARPNR